MLELFLLRHAKSSWENDLQSDHDRPLNNRGCSDASMMAQRMIERQDIPEIIYCSSSVRATTTALLVAAEIGIEDDAVTSMSDAYTFEAAEVLQLVRQFDAAEKSILLVGHNPALTVVANQFSKQPITNLPTCGLFKLVSQGKQWTEISPENTELLYFDYPKKRSSD